MRPSRPEVICLDVDGTLTSGVGGPPIAGAVEAVRRLRRTVPVRLVSNTTSRSHRAFAAWLVGHGLLDRPEDLITPVAVARRLLPQRAHDRGLLLVDEEAREDFQWFHERAEGPAVLLGTEAHDHRVRDLQPAFRALLGGAALYTLQQNRYFRRDGELVTDLGPIAAFLSYAAGCPAENLGKPSRCMFEAAAASAGASAERTLLAGDDAEFDASGAVALGLIGVLVRTGKYRVGDEDRVSPPPSAVIDSVADLPDWLGLD